MLILKSIFLFYRVFLIVCFVILVFIKTMLSKIFGKKSKNKESIFYDSVNKNSLFKGKENLENYLTDSIAIKNNEKISEENYVVWLGNQAILSKINGEKIIINPIFIFRGKTPYLDCNFCENEKNNSIPIEMPKINYMFISQSHLNYFTQLNRDNIEKLNNKIENILCPKKIAKYLKILGFKSVKELNLGEEIKLNKNLKANVLQFKVNNKEILDNFSIEDKKHILFYDKNNLNSYLVNIVEKNKALETFEKYNEQKNIRSFDYCEKNYFEKQNNYKRQKFFSKKDIFKQKMDKDIKFNKYTQNDKISNLKKLNIQKENEFIGKIKTAGNFKEISLSRK